MDEKFEERTGEYEEREGHRLEQAGGIALFLLSPVFSYVMFEFVTGNFAKRAYKEAQKYGDVRVAASSEDKNFTYIPDFDDSSFRSDIDYVHCTSNNTIYGSRMRKFPSVETLVCDMSSNILSEVYDVNKFGVIYAGAQKNISCAGVTVVIVRKDLLDHAMPICPTMLKWSTQAKENSLYNTPPCFSIYIASLTLKWLKNLGGIPAIQKINEEKAKMLYDYIDTAVSIPTQFVPKTEA